LHQSNIIELQDTNCGLIGSWNA